MSDLFQTLHAPRRREILRLVWDEERSAGEIHRALDDVTFGAVSQHLRILEETGLVGCRREGRHRYYRARPESLGDLRSWLESTWGSALARLQLRAEMEASRRGPRAASPASRRTRKTRRTR